VASIARAPSQSTREPGAADGCPGVLRLHAAADGYLARVRLPGGRLDARALDALAKAASLGSDIVELTSRAGLQVRGLAEDCGGELAQLLAAGGLLPSLTHERVRNIVAPPLAGRDPASLAPVDAVVEELDRELCADATLAELPGRFLFAIDDGTRVLDRMRADVQMTAERDGERRVFRLSLDGRATSLTVVAERAPDAALRAAHAFLELRHENSDGAWRVRELHGGAERLAHHLGLDLLERSSASASASAPAPASAAATASEPAAARGRRLGLRIQRDGLLAVAVLPPLARVGRAQLERLAQLARGLDSGADLDARVRVSPWRTLTFVDVPASVVAPLLDELQGMGLIASEDSGWSGLSACAGMGACARARADVRAAAAGRALVRKPSSPSEHWSGCERRCGEPTDAGVRVVADERGLTVSCGEAAGSDEHSVATTAAALELLDRASVRA
jgi:precorrin-3B synthase